MNRMLKTFSLVGIAGLLLALAPLNLAAAPRYTADWVQENASRLANGRVRVQVAMVKSLGVRPDGRQQSFQATTWADGEAGGTIIVLVDANRGSAFERKFGTTMERDEDGEVKTKRLDGIARVNPANGEIVILTD